MKQEEKLTQLIQTWGNKEKAIKILKSSMVATSTTPKIPHKDIEDYVKNTIKIEDLVIYRTQKESKTYRSKILNKTFRFVRHKVIEYVNIKTGEIIPYSLAKQIGVTEFDYEPLTEERNEILNSFRKEVKDFACFVLIFRNKRRGLSPNIEQVTEYYSKFSGMRKNNIKTRLLPPLMNKVLHSSTLMMPPFQINDKKATAREHLQEDFIAENKFFDLMFKKAFRAEEV